MGLPAWCVARDSASHLDRHQASNLDVAAAVAAEEGFDGRTMANGEADAVAFQDMEVAFEVEVVGEPSCQAFHIGVASPSAAVSVARMAGILDDAVAAVAVVPMAYVRLEAWGC